MADEKSRIWLCGITQNCKDGIDVCTKDVFKYFDGIVFVDHQSNDGTRELLESRKGNGEIISLPWRHHHGWSYNAVLTSHKILPGDWICWMDSLEKWNTDICLNIRNLCDNLTRQNIKTVFYYGKVLMFQYYPDLFFALVTPHQFLANPKQPSIEISNNIGFENIRENLRNVNRPKDHSIDHFCKYVLEYKHNNNQLTCGRENNQNEIAIKEEIRQKFLVHLNRELGVELNVESLKNYILNNEIKYTTKWFFNQISYLNDFYCYHKLGHNLDDIFKRRGNNFEIFEIK